MYINQVVGRLHIKNNKSLKRNKMIRTKTEIYNLRSGGTSKIYIEITEEINDEANEKFIFNIQDYVVLNDGSKKIINSKNVEYTYVQRDGLKDIIVEELNLTGSESEINKRLKPLALLYITKNEPLYNLNANDFELII